MFKHLANLTIGKEYSLLQIFNRLTEIGEFKSDLSFFITILYNNPNFVIKMPHNQPPETFTIKRIKDYEH
jgi:hypothetical protein